MAQKPLERDLFDLEQRYKKTSNPVHVARAWLVCRGAGVSIPDWVLRYLDTAFGNVQALTRPAGALRTIEGWHTTTVPTAPARKRDIAPAIPAAFGFVSGGQAGAFNPFNEFTNLDALTLASQVADALRRDSPPYKISAYWKLVADANDVGKTTVENAWKQYGGFAGFGISER